MTLTPPVQQRTADPYSEVRYTQTLNRFTRVITGGDDMVLKSESSFICNIIDWYTVNIEAGIAVKDDTLVHINQDYDVDFTDQDLYIDDSDTMISEGYYFLLLQYNYARTLPAPKAYYRICRNSLLFTNYPSRYIYLASIYVRWNGAETRYEIDTARIPYYRDPIQTSIVRPIPTHHALVVDGGNI